jgi:hypothetical protein
MAALLAISAEARITRIQIAKTEPAFGGISFGTVGPYERLTGKAFGEVDPKAPGNALIQDIQLAPKNARGMVEYVTDIDIVRPVDLSKSNGILFFNIVNRGNKGGLPLFNANVPGQVADINNLVNAGDGFMERKGYTMIWFGWQADILPGGGRMTISVPVARNPDGIGDHRNRKERAGTEYFDRHAEHVEWLVQREFRPLSHGKYRQPHRTCGWISSHPDGSPPTAGPAHFYRERGVVLCHLRTKWRAGNTERHAYLLSRGIQTWLAL